MISARKVNLAELAREIRGYEQEWVAISAENRIVAHGKTYGETLEKVAEPEEVVLFKVPPSDASLAPLEA